MRMEPFKPSRHLRKTNSNRRMKKSLAIIFCFFLIPSAFSEVRLPQLIRDSMILQRDSKINIWGWAAPGEKIKINFNRKNLSTTTDANGKWSLQLPAMKAGGPYTMNIDGSNHIT